MSWSVEGYFPDCGPNGEFRKAEVHIFPTDEAILHNLEGDFCFCSPRIEDLRKGKMIVHASTGGREFRE